MTRTRCNLPRFVGRPCTLVPNVYRSRRRRDRPASSGSTPAERADERVSWYRHPTDAPGGLMTATGSDRDTGERSRVVRSRATSTRRARCSNRRSTTTPLVSSMRSSASPASWPSVTRKPPRTSPTRPWRIPSGPSGPRCTHSLANAEAEVDVYVPPVHHFDAQELLAAPAVPRIPPKPRLCAHTGTGVDSGDSWDTKPDR